MARTIRLVPLLDSEAVLRPGGIAQLMAAVLIAAALSGYNADRAEKIQRSKD